MRETQTKRLFIVVGLLLYLLFIITYVNSSYPYVGHDYRYSLTRLFDTHLHQQTSGISIQWFTPSFGGGLPSFANPEDVQFSITQGLVFLVNPWIAVMLSIAIYTGIGYYAGYQFGRDVLQVGWKSAVLGSLFFIGTGFYIQHVSTGPMTVQAYPLIALFLYLLFMEKWNVWARGLGMSVILAVYLYGSGFYLIIVLVFTMLVTVPLFYMLFPDRLNLKQMAAALVIAGLVGGLLSIGKLYAVFGFLGNFPRLIADQYYGHVIEAIVGFMLQLSGVPLFTVPLRFLRGTPTAVGEMMTALVGGRQFGMWEMDVSVSPVLLYIIFFQLRKIPRKIKTAPRLRWLPKLEKRQWVALMVLVFGVWFTFEFISTRGALYRMVHMLPVLRSLHINIRYTAGFVFPLSMLGAILFDREFVKLALPKQFPAFLFFFSGVFIWLSVYYWLPNDLQSRDYNLTSMLNDYQAHQNGEAFFVAEVMDIPDMGVFARNASSLYPYEPIFGYDLEDFDTQLVPGSIYLESDGYYNLTNPRSLVYDSEALFERFHVNQREMMEQFVHYQQPDWDIPVIQRVLNAISGVTAIGLLALLIGWGLKGILKRSRRSG